MKFNLAHKLYWFIINARRKHNSMRIIVGRCGYLYYKLLRANKQFTFQEKKYKYFYHRYNRTVASERIVEIPIAYDILRKYKGKEVLEVGNVLSHYFPIEHDVLDKYEKARGVINEDVISFKSKKKYDLIFSVSTMEHVGWTYGEEKDSGKFLKGIKNLQKLLKKNGKMVVTFPLFYRDDLSQLIIQRKMPFQKEYFMKRVSFWNEWIEVTYRDAIKGEKYDNYYANANVLYIGILEN